MEVKHKHVDLSKGTKISDGGLAGVAVTDGKPEALGEYVIAKKVTGNEFTRGGLILAPGTNVKFIVESVGSAVDLDIEKGDELIVATLTEIPIWDPVKQESDNYCFYHKKQIMGVIRAKKA